MKRHLDDDWLARRIDTLRPGWRGRVWLRAPEEAETSDTEELYVTVVAEPAFERDSEHESVIDATLTLCSNYRNGRFVPLQGEPSFTVRASRIAAMEALP